MMQEIITQDLIDANGTEYIGAVLVNSFVVTLSLMARVEPDYHNRLGMLSSLSQM